MDNIESTDVGRSTSTRSGQRVAIRVIFLLAALTALRFGVTWSEHWQLVSKARFRHEAAGWIGWLLLLAVSGFLFAVAARLPKSLHYRPWTPLLLAIVPTLMLAQPIVILGFEWTLPTKILNDWYFFWNFETQFALAVMLGVALASGFEGQERWLGEHPRTLEPPDETSLPHHLGRWMTFLVRGPGAS